MQYLEYPQYTRPEEVYGLNVPDILLTGNTKEIEQRRREQSQNIGALDNSAY